MKLFWRGILSKIHVRANDGSFGATYPAICEDGTFVVSANMRQFDDTLRAEIPTLAVYAEEDDSYRQRRMLQILGSQDSAPSTPDILDLIEFCWKSVGKPISQGRHEFLHHTHLTFDIDAGREEFRDEIEIFFRRNGIAYQLTEEGQITILLKKTGIKIQCYAEALANQDFDTGDSDLDDLLNRSLSGFRSARPGERMDALLKLWDAWERLKTIDGPDKAALIKIMLEATAGPDSPKFGEALDKDANGLTWVGNNLRIRHSETDKERLARNEHVDYLFHRMFSLIQMILRLR